MKKKLWLLMPSYDYEGYSAALAAYTTEKRAKNARERLYEDPKSEYWRGGNPCIEIEEVEIIA